jgi:hypothetical protein
VRLPVSPSRRADERRQEFRIESSPGIAEDESRDRRVILSAKLLLESGGQKGFADIARRRLSGRECHVCVQRGQWQIFGRSSR